MNKDLIWYNSIFSPPESTKIFESLPKALGKIVSQYPDSPAVISEGEVFTFRDLTSRIAGLSDEINEFRHYSGPVALVQKIGLDSIAAWFACSLSGKPFLLLEPDNPPARLIELVKSSGCTLALVDHSTSHIFKDSPEIIQLVSDGRLGTLIQDNGLLAEDPAMIFPTSGSTGNPKLITYATITIQVKVQASIKLMGIPEGERVMIAGSHSNYGFLHHALVFLLSGNAVCLGDVKSLGFDSILHAITHLGVRHVRFTPSLFRKLVEVPKALKVLKLLDAVRFSGEPLLENDLKLAQSVLKPDCLIQNVYGSTESALFIWNSSVDNPNDAASTVPIGRIYPLSSYAIRPIENDQNNSKGELLVRSRFHALGDFNGGIIDRERFPLLEGSTDERIYATGDIVQQLPNGNLIHLGRLGRMVKIRGHRVYLSEVEQQLRTIPGVSEAVVVERIEQDNTVIYGFITTEYVSIKSEAIRIYLSSRLPDFMIPKRIEALSQIPLMAGGKVDYQALLALISMPESIEYLKEFKTEDEHLIQIWDSLLWEGAHKHSLDFFSLGGDSLSFMILLTELEQKFGISLAFEELRHKCTFNNISLILGVDLPDKQPMIKYKSIQVELVWPCLGYSKGTALAMPGYGGSSHAYPFHKAGFFQDHDIWVVETPMDKSNMLHENSWWIVAREIVQGIQEGIIPAPRVVFGFSFGGGLAWLVGRLLAGSRFAPKFIIMLDAPPLHRRWGLRHISFNSALKKESNIELPMVLHIRRSPLGKGDIYKGYKQEWSHNDNIQCLIDLPTVNHIDMAHLELLTHVKDNVVAFLNSEKTDFKWMSVMPPSNLLGSHIFYALNGSQDSLKKVMDELAKGADLFRQDYIVDIAILMHTINDKNKSEELIQIAVKKFPDSGTVHFLNRRVRRNFNMLFLGDIPKIYPLSIFSVENQLSSSMDVMTRPKPRAIRLICLAFDVASALLASRYVRWQHLVLLSLRRRQKDGRLRSSEPQ